MNKNLNVSSAFSNDPGQINFSEPHHLQNKQTNKKLESTYFIVLLEE